MMMGQLLGGPLLQAFLAVRQFEAGREPDDIEGVLLRY
jgi:hypothetical protein